LQEQFITQAKLTDALHFQPDKKELVDYAQTYEITKEDIS
jgi:hypothetical protein